MYRVIYRKSVVKFLQKQDRKFVKEIVDFFEKIKKDLDFQGYDVKPLKGLKETYRLRVSKYRVIFRIDRDDILIEVVRASSRGDVYKKG